MLVDWSHFLGTFNHSQLVQLTSQWDFMHDSQLFVKTVDCPLLASQQNNIFPHPSSSPHYTIIDTDQNHFTSSITHHLTISIQATNPILKIYKHQAHKIPLTLGLGNFELQAQVLHFFLLQPHVPNQCGEQISSYIHLNNNNKLKKEGQFKLTQVFQGFTYN